MPDKLLRMVRSRERHGRPVMLAIAGDSAAGKTTLTQGLVQALGPERCVSLCADDYHRYDREERKGLPFTPLHPDCNYVDIMEQHLELLATGHPILKPVYDHATGLLARPVLVEPHEVVIVEGLLPLHTKLSRACFDVTVYLDPPEDVRRRWKVARDTSKRGYTEEQVLAELERREPESEAWIRPQRTVADIVLRFGPIPGRDDPPDTPLSVEALLRPTLPHLALADVLPETGSRAMHVKMVRDVDGRPVDALHIHGYAPREESRAVQEALWADFGGAGPVPAPLGRLNGSGLRSEPLALSQLLLLAHVERAAHH